MRVILHIILFAFPLLHLYSQPQTFRENGKWGIKDKENIIIKPAYDTVFNFDSTERVCLACYRTRTPSPNKFMKIMVTSYSCNYLNKKGEKLFIKTSANDTCSTFSLSKNSARQYHGSENFFIAAVKGKKYLLTKDFLQLTFNDYQEISLSDDPYYYVTQKLNEGDVLLTGLVNKKEEEIIPYNYAEIKINPADSLIIACSAGVRPNAEDDVFGYDGKRVISSRRHIDMATKNFLIHRIFEPKEHYIFYNIRTKEEKEILADDLRFHEKDEVLLKIKNDWFIYDMNTNQKKPRTKS